MQIFAGDFQACFYTAVAAGLFMAFGLIDSPRRTTALIGVLGMYAGAAALGAVQLLTTFQAASESIRGGGVTYEFASTVSLAPENAFTLLAPGFFGNGINLPYWGRWPWWEMCLFIGVSGLALAVYGAIRGKRELRRRLVPLLAIMFVLAHCSSFSTAGHRGLTGFAPMPGLPLRHHCLWPCWPRPGWIDC